MARATFSQEQIDQMTSQIEEVGQRHNARLEIEVLRNGWKVCAFSLHTASDVKVLRADLEAIGMAVTPNTAAFEAA